MPTNPTDPTDPPSDDEEQPRGLECPDCGCRHFYVVYTRKREDRIVRRRECRHCDRKILTVERLVA